MKIIVPMAGRGSRLRPHTLTTPKPLIPVGGIPIVHRLVADIAEVCNDKITDIGFVIGDFGKEVEEELIQVAEKLGAQGHIFHQESKTSQGLFGKNHSQNFHHKMRKMDVCHPNSNRKGSI